jgi:photosystem II stability/assembly factor-like uncharacterized protein
MRYLVTIICFVLILCLGCRKDLIRYRSVVRVETGSDSRWNRILFVNDTLGFVVGGERFVKGEVLTTRDGGRSWVLYTSPEAQKSMFGVAAAPDGGIYVIGFDGNMLKSSDGGRSWRFIQSRFEAYKAIAFSDETHAQAVGGVSFERGDALYIDTAGHVLAHDSLGYELNDIVLLRDGNGWRCGYGVMQHTTNGGKTWEWQELRNDNYTALDVHGALVAYACGGEGSICATKDGGASWETLRNGNELTKKKYRLRDIVFRDELHGYAVGEKGLVIYTDDGGLHWSELEEFTETHLHGVAIAPGGNLIVCGEDGELWRIEL